MFAHYTALEDAAMLQPTESEISQNCNWCGPSANLHVSRANAQSCVQVLPKGPNNHDTRFWYAVGV